MTDLRIAQDLKLPIDFVTQATGILAKRRAGKSYTARRLFEQVFLAGQQVVALDPKGDWWGARSSADGKSDGLPVVIFGGEHGDVPLESASGALLARVVVEERVNAILDLSLFRKHELARFATDFLEDLYRLKAREVNRTPLALFIDEADAIAPQKPQPNEARMLGAAQDIVRRGGQRGIGCVMITQRSAVLSKDVLTQVQMLVCLRTIAPQDLDAVKAWIDVHGTVEQRKILLASLPSLPVGDAWFWSPGWPTDDGIFQRSHVLPIATFDSGATPKPGQQRTAPKRLADVDLDAVRAQMAEVIERAKADDPASLRARITELEGQLADGAAEAGDLLVQENERLRACLAELESAPPAPAVSEDQIARLETAAQQLHTTGIAALEAARGVMAALPSAHPGEPTHLYVKQEHLPVLGKLSSKPAQEVVHRDAKPARTPRISTDDFSPEPPVAARPGSKLGKGEVAVLTAIAQHRDGVTREQLTVLTGYKKSSRDTYLQKLRSGGFTEESGRRIHATASGRKELGPGWKPLPMGAKLREYWLARLPAGERVVLEVLISAHPSYVTRDTISRATGYKKSSRDTYIQKLRARRLAADAERGGVKASDELF